MKAVVQRRIELARSEPKRGDWKIPGEVIGTWMVLLGAELPIASSVSGGECVCACVCGRDHCWKISLYSARGPVVRYEIWAVTVLFTPPSFNVWTLEYLLTEVKEGKVKELARL